MMNRIDSEETPSLLLLEYDNSWSVTNLTAVHHLLITTEAIQPRKPLSPFARRKGWIGCNILLKEIPLEGRINIIRSGVVVPRDVSRYNFSISEGLYKLSVSERTWASNLLRLLHSLNKEEFTLAEAYSFENQLKSRYTNNQNIKPKIRQQLQTLRDAGVLLFIKPGVYRFLTIQG